MIKSAGLHYHIADLKLALERMRPCGLKMNPLKCDFGVWLESFIIHENGIEVDPKRIEAMRKVEAPTYKKGPQTRRNRHDKEDAPKNQGQGPPISCPEEGRPWGVPFGLSRPPGSSDPLMGQIRPIFLQ